MTDIKVEIQGQDAAAATEALLAIPGISGSWEPIAGTRRETVIATVATIVGLVGGSLAIAEQIRKWYQEYKEGKSGKNIEKVLIIDEKGQRILLQDATIEQIRQILEG